MARKSHLYEYHKLHGKITEFSGFDMPLWYKGIVDEHLAVRNAAGLFDVSHMGRLWIRGRDATKFLRYLLPTNPTPLRDLRAFYSTICNERGGIVDDVITNKFSDEAYMMVVNAGNREKDLAWIGNLAEKYNVSVEDFSDDSALMAIQGPLAAEILQEICDVDLGTIRRFSFSEGRVDGERALLSRTGYTGEDGFEITIFGTPLLSPEKAMKVWEKLLSVGSELGLLPCGLGARDSLRLEAGMCLYGQDIDDSTTPVEAALDAVVSNDARDYVGKSAIVNQLERGPSRRRVCFSMIESGIPRHGYDILLAGQKVGTVTSGSFSPILRNGIGMGYVPQPISSLGQSVSILIRDSEKRAVERSAPFYDTADYGYKREKRGIGSAATNIS